jgi:hypothetical protein
MEWNESGGRKKNPPWGSTTAEYIEIGDFGKQIREALDQFFLRTD